MIEVSQYFERRQNTLQKTETLVNINGTQLTPNVSKDVNEASPIIKEAEKKPRVSMERVVLDADAEAEKLYHLVIVSIVESERQCRLVVEEAQKLRLTTMEEKNQRLVAI